MSDLASYALTNVADVKESLGLASSDHSKDNLIIRKINYVTDLIENYCSRRFLQTTYTQEEYHASGIDEIALRQRPIVVDASHTFLAEIRNSALNVSDWETIDSQLCFIDNASGVITFDFNAVGNANRYRFTYTAGYPTIPSDLAEAANVLACYFVNNPAGFQVGIQVRREGQRETRYSNTNTNLKLRNIAEQLGIDSVLDSYSNLPLLTDR